MTTEINKVRFTGSIKDLSQWKAFYKELEARGLITIIQCSEPYPRRNSQLYSQYYELKFNGEIPA